MPVARPNGAQRLARLAWILVIPLMVAGGCASHETWPARSHDPTLVGKPAPGSPAPAMAFEPRRIRVHPLTRRIDSAGGPPVASAATSADAGGDLEVRVECLDADEIETRTIGVLWLELQHEGERWTVGPVDLTRPDVNRATFETVTRTYRMSVTLTDAQRPPLGSTLRIDAFLRLPSGVLLEDRFDLAWR